MTILAKAALALGLVLSAAFTASLSAQSQFSQAGAQAIINRQDWNGLLAYGQAWAKAEPDNPTAWYVIARADGSKSYNIGLGRPADAAAAYERVVRLNPRWVEAWHALGLTRQELGQWKESAAALEQATRLVPQRTNSWDFLCASYMHTHQFQQAAQAADSLEKYAQRAGDWFQAGSCYYAVAPYFEPVPMYQKSKAAFLKVLQRDPRNGAAWTNLGTTEQALNNTDAAFADYRKGAQLGNKQGGINDANLAADIQACMIKRRALSSGTHYMMEVTSYNNSCTNYTGEIKVIYLPY
jgi:tetratricopeptide (TPR) repeat protein